MWWVVAPDVVSVEIALVVSPSAVAVQSTKPPSVVPLSKIAAGAVESCWILKPVAPVANALSLMIRTSCLVDVFALLLLK